MSQNKTLAKNSLLLYFRLIVVTIVGLITTRIVVRNLGASDYGLYNVVGSIVVMMNFLNTVMVSTTYRYIAYELGKGKEGNVNKIFNISFSIHLALILIVILLAETLGIWYIRNYLNIDPNKLQDAIFVFRFSVIATVINIFSIPFQGLVTALEKFSVKAIIEILRSVVKLIFVILLAYYLGNKLRFYSVLMAIATVIPSFLFIIYCTKKYPLFTKIKVQRDVPKYKEMLGYSGWIMIGAAASVGKNTGTPIIVNYFFGTILNAAYSIANQINHFLILFTQGLTEAAIPQITKNFSGGNNKRVLNLAAYISKYSFLLLFLPALPILLETNYLVHLWIGEIPKYTVLFCKLMIINALFDSLNSGIPAVIQASGKIKWFQIINSTLLLLGLPITFLLFKFGYPPHYSITVYIIISAINIVINIILLKKIINFDVKFLMKTSYYRACLVTLTVLPLFFIVPLFNESITRFIITVIFSILYYVIAVYFIGLEDKERNMIKSGLKILKLKLKISK